MIGSAQFTLLVEPGVRHIGQSPGCTDRTVKYIANSPAKNMSSLESHTIVPTLTMLGRVSEWILLAKPGSVAVDVTHALLPAGTGRPPLGWARVAAAKHGAPTARSHPGYDRRVTAAPDQVTVLVYSNMADVRAQVRTAVGRRPAPDTGRIEWIECATQSEVQHELDAGGVDVAILDGEAQPTGGMGLARQYKYELDDCPPVVVLIARRQDGWLASWSLADAVINAPIDPVESASVVAEQLRRRYSGIPVVR